MVFKKIKKWGRRTLSAILLSSILLTPNCKKEEEYFKQEPSGIEWKDKVHVYETGERNPVSSLENNLISFESKQDLKKGDIIAGIVKGKDESFLGEITLVEDFKNYKIKRISYEEAIQNGKFFKEFNIIEASEKKGIDIRDYILQGDSIWVENLNPHFNKRNSEDLSFEFEKKLDNLTTVFCHVELNPSMIIEIDYSLGKLKRFYLEARAKPYLDLETKSNSNGTYTLFKEITTPEIYLGHVPLEIGGLPVWMDVYGKIIFGVNGSIGNLESKVSNNSSFETSLEYSQKYWNFEKYAHIGKIEYLLPKTVGAKFEAYAKPELIFMVNSFTGPKVGIKGGLNLSVEGAEDYALSANVYGIIGAEMDAFGKEILNKEKEFFIYENMLEEKTSNKIPVANLLVNPSSGNTYTTFRFDGSSSYDLDGNISFYIMDFEGDGVYDGNYQTSPSFEHIYTTSGTYKPTLKVVDNEGASNLESKTITVSAGGNPSSTFTDPRDGQVYKIVEINGDWWFAENLNYYSKDGSVYYENDSSKNHIYGRLYNFNTAKSACPSGWSLADDSGWGNIFWDKDEGYNNSAGRLKETGTTHWQSPNFGATNSTGFTALPGGYYLVGKSFEEIGKSAYFWTSERDIYQLKYTHSEFVFHSNSSYDWCSVRCVKD